VKYGKVYFVCTFQYNSVIQLVLLHSSKLEFGYPFSQGNALHQVYQNNGQNKV